jgi:18S rRNA (guanine1575-N7)-methyltransferase
MPRKTDPPKFPDSYVGEKAEEYDTLIWMERNQKKSTNMALNYLYSEYSEDNKQFRGPYLFLDLGCGTGYSSEVLLENGHRVIGIEVLNDMIIKARNKKILFQNNNNFELILADINYLPLKRNSIDHIISISAYNFITYNRNNERDKIKTINNTAKYLYKVLKSESGRIVIEFYPKDDEELDLFVSSFKKNGFDGYLIKSKPNQKAGQTYLNLKKIR